LLIQSSRSFICQQIMCILIYIYIYIYI
jgi:hypothetical protein